MLLYNLEVDILIVGTVSTVAGSGRRDSAKRIGLHSSWCDGAVRVTSVLSSLFTYMHLLMMIENVSD